MRFVDDATIARLLRWEELIPAVKQAMIDFSCRRVAQPPRRMLEVPGAGGWFGSMPASSAEALGAKLVSFFPGNRERGVGTHHALIALFDPETGAPLAVLDGERITAMRTAAVTAAFVDVAAPAEVEVLAVLGAGVQGRAHVEALGHVRRFREIRLWNRTPERAERLAAEVGGRATSREEAVRDADVVVVATASPEPVLEGRWLRPGTRVASVGWSGADGAELDAETMRGVVVVDSREGTRTESGNVRRWQPEIFAELGEVLDGSRPLPVERTVVFDSIGMACQDVAAATVVWERLGLEGSGE